MQPPLRKIKESQQVKVVFSEQLSKLQTKQHQNSDLLEEIRSFSKQRAAIEKEYGQALQRLAVQYQKRDWQRGSTDANTSGTVFSLWRSLVDATAQTATSRLAAAEEYHSLIGQASKSLQNAKDIRVKRGLDRLQRVQGEVVDALRELHGTNKNYHHLCHIASMAREKAADTQNRARKSEHGMFHFKSGLHKMNAKLSAQLKECDDRLTEARNEYLLTLAAINAQLQYYYTQDLPMIMEQIDGDVYDDFRHHFSLLCGTEMETCLTTQNQFSRIWDSVTKVTRERNIQQFLQEVVSFGKIPDFTFQPAPPDKESALQDIFPSEGDSCLQKEAKKWATKAAKDYKIITHGQRALQMLKSRLKLLSGETELSVEQRIAEVQETVRKAQLSRVKAEARLVLLSQSVSGTEQWLHSAMEQAEEELDRERCLSQQRRSTEDFSEEEFELTNFEEYEDVNRDIFADSVSASGVRVYPAACRVIYNYQASQSDELPVVEGEELHAVEDRDVDDWLKVGYVPERYVQFLCLPAEDTPQLDSSLSSTSSKGNKDRVHSRGVVRALYSYQAQSPEELSFQEGALIHLICCPHSEVDDGFWEGELDGRIGLFPSLLVELLHNEEEEAEEKETPFSAPVPVPVPSVSDGNSAVGAAPASGVEDNQQPVLMETPKLTEAGASGPAPPEFPSNRIRPCRAPPPPPTQKL
ncbi:F-BAR and double SH3 domains protein 1 [Kryptolebias marmoratus]|uniref:F-BAR and double SH3 domains protein 1 n=1 Tax=Kryptolebias marmoratus TaxID=37003 RepID=UPI0018ACFBF1|nr:F-BAR and double SH3 domains protein 1 [Kryptolebias marmoratus]